MSTEKPEAFSAILDRHSDVAPALSGSPQDITAYLLSPERAQRFELLMLLISNLGKVLVVSGPDGIGKSTFLGLLKQRAFESWRVVRVAGDARLRHGDIITQIAEQLAMATVSEHALTDYLEQLGRHKNLLVLLLDDAGKVAPGVLSALWQFACKYPAFRLVLALRPDEAHLKIATDESVLGECHYIDIPALTAPKCKSYLKRLATRPPRLLSVEDITPARTRAVYRASHGVPGRIIQLLINAPAARAKARRRRFLAMAAVLVIGMAVVLAYFQFRRTDADAPAEGGLKPSPLYPPPPPLEPAAAYSRPLPQTPALPVELDDESDKAAGADELAAPPHLAQAPKEPPPSVVSQVAAASAKQQASATHPIADGPPLPEIGATQKPAEPAAKRLALTPESYGPPLSDDALAKAGTAQAEKTADDSGQAGPGGDLEPSADDTGAPIAVAGPGEATNGAVLLEAPNRSRPAMPLAEPTVGNKAPHAAGAQTAKTPPAGGAAKPTPAGVRPGASLPRQAASSATAPVATANPLAIAGLRDAAWLLAQPPQAYTLQVMVVREPSSIKVLLQRYPAMQGQVASFTSRHGAVTSHPVYYGIFASEAEAKRAAAKLPPALGKPLLRQLKPVQQEARASQR